MQTCYILLGSNLGDKEKNLHNALYWINHRIGKITSQSSLYSSEAWGFETSDIFLNQAIGVEISETPANILKQLHELETLIGRKRNENGGYTSRLIDLDILFCDDTIVDDNEVVLPHPLLHKRKFVLIPMNEIAPDFVHPVFRKTIHALLLECNDRLKVQIYKPTHSEFSPETHETI